MKKITLGFSVIAVAALFTIGCNKKTNPEPVQDKEFQSSVDVAYANSMATEIEQIAAFLGEGQLISSYFSLAPGSGGAITTTVLPMNVVKVIYTGTPTCRDGKKRDGELAITYSSNPVANNANAMRDPGFVAVVALTNYAVDGVLIDDVNIPFVVHNILPLNYTASTDKMKWTITGELSFTNTVDASKNMTWKGSFTKTLVNSTSASILNPSKLMPIAWSSSTISPGANIEYTGTSNGLTAVSKPYVFKIDSLNPLQKQFGCSPDKVIGVNSTTTTPITVIPVYSEWHPFVGGIANFTTNALPEARKLDFSNAGTADCDNAGTVTIKGISYPIDFIK